MSAILFIHGFATGPDIWKEQIREFSKDYGIVSDAEHIDHASDVFIVGWSMGGWKAIELCLEHHHKVKGLALVSAFAKYVKSDDYPAGTPLVLLRKLEKRFSDSYQEGMRYFYDLVFRDKSMHNLMVHLPPSSEHDLKRWFEKLEHEDLRPQLPKIKVPTLVIHGDQDPIVPVQAAEYIHDKVKNSELHIFSGVGHAPFLERKKKFNQCLKDFIKKHEG